MGMKHYEGEDHAKMVSKMEKMHKASHADMQHEKRGGEMKSVARVADAKVDSE